jgi:maltooligosyltrehalose trehalohydrolase
VKLETWAPRAREVSVVLEGRRIPMEQMDRGRWSVLVDLAAGAEYRFSIDGGEPLADPRSASQPAGVFGPSAIVDHAAFRWTDAAWRPPPLDTGIIYELHVGTFTPEGTFDAAMARLDHLVALGVTHVEVMPVNEFSGDRGWGYDGVLIWAPHHAYGGPNGFKRFVDACHARGLAVLLDVVYNHFGPEGSVVGRFGPYVTDQYKTPWGDGINLDGPGSHDVRRFLCDNALMWMRDYHCDGLRLDAVHGIRDSSALPFLEQLSMETDALSERLGRPLTLIAETYLNDPKTIRRRDEHGYGMAAQWNDDFHHAIQVTFSGERLGYFADYTPWRDLVRALREGFVFQGEYAPYLDRSRGRPASLPGHRLVGFLQNHDQIGNASRGRRISHRLGVARSKVAAALLMSAPFIPLLFQGEEWGASSPFPFFCAHRDPALVRAVREGRQKEFPGFAGEDPDPESPETFQAARLRWEEVQSGEHPDLLAWYTRLIRLRRSLPDLVDGRLDRCVARCDERAGWLMLTRGTVSLALNIGRESVEVPLHARMILASSGAVQPSERALTLGPDAVAILQV